MAPQPSTFKTFTSMGDSPSAFEEANAASSNGRLFKGVTIIRSGLGNKRDRHLYTPKALQEAVRTGLFNDLDAYVDHPTSVDEQIQPERSVRDRAGVYRNPRYVEEGNGGRVVADLHVLEPHEWVAKGIRELVGMGLGHKMGVSIIGSGQTSAAKHRETGGEEMDVQRVDKFVRIKSADFVTQAGAGGGFSNLLESAREAAQEHNDMDPKALVSQISEAAQAGDLDKVKDLTGQLNALLEKGGDFGGKKAKPFGKKKDAADGDAEDKVDGGADEADEADAKKKDTKEADAADEPAADADADVSKADEDADADATKEDEDEDPVEEASKLPGAGNKTGKSVVKAAKRKNVGQKYAKESDADGDVSAELKSLRESVAALQGQIAAKDLQVYVTKRLSEAKLPEKAKAKVGTKVSKMTERKAVDTEITFQEGFYAEFKGAELSKFEEVEGAGGSTHEHAGGGASTGIEQLTEAITGSGLKLKAKK